MEIAEVGFLYNAIRLADEGVFDRHASNFWLDYLLGYGAMPANARQLGFIAEGGVAPVSASEMGSECHGAASSSR